MAARAKSGSQKRSEEVLPSPLDPPAGQHPSASDPNALSKLQIHVAKLYGQGLTRTQIAKTLIDYLVPSTKGRPMEQRLSQARAKLRRWEQRELFRDAVYRQAVVAVDMATPGILKGVVRKAKQGRVDAARLALEVTGRHNPKGDGTPPSVVVAINGIPRPQTPTSGEVIEAEVVREED